MSEKPAATSATEEKDRRAVQRKLRAERAKAGPSPAALLLRDQEAAVILGVSLSQVVLWKRSGLLTSIPIPGIRATRLARSQVEALACKWVELAEHGDGERKGAA